MSAHWWRCFWALTRMETLRMLRTREVWTRMLVPSLLFPIAMLALLTGILLVMPRLDDGRVVAISPDTPEELPLAAELTAAGWEVRVVDRPKQAVRSGEAQLGLGPWQPGAGLGTRVGERLAPMDAEFDRVGLPRSERYLWTVQVWDSEETDNERISELRDVEDAVFEAVLASHGLDAEGLGWPLRLVRVDDADDDDRRLFDDLPVVLGHQVRVVEVVQVFGSVMAAALGLQLLALGPVSDRTEGIFETLATSAAPGHAILAARGVASVVVLWGVSALMVVPLAGFVLQVEDAPFTLVDAVAYLSAAVVWCAGTYLPVGTLSRSLQEANAIGAYAGGLAMAGATALALLPPWGALVVAGGWLTVWVVGLGGSDALARPPKADTP